MKEEEIIKGIRIISIPLFVSALLLAILNLVKNPNLKDFTFTGLLLLVLVQETELIGLERYLRR